MQVKIGLEPILLNLQFNTLPIMLFDLFYMIRNNTIRWVYINGRLFAFQAKDEGSNPSIHNIKKY